MIAKRIDGKIVLLSFCSIFHELSACPWNGDMKDRFGRLWSPVLDEETLLKCYYCDTDRVFPDNPARESSVVFI